VPCQFPEKFWTRNFVACLQVAAGDAQFDFFPPCLANFQKRKVLDEEHIFFGVPKLFIDATLTVTNIRMMLRLVFVC
jgi:hypothetical protein